ncbi:MAG: DUF5011 domain-containing protein [Bacteroidia bacterium]
MKTLKLVLALLTVGVLASCEKDTTSGFARETNYPIFTVSGADPMFVSLGTTFTDPGVDASEGGNSIPVTTSAVGQYRGGSTVDGNVSDRYVLTYSASNKDGFSGTAGRVVYVVKTGDLTTSIEGLYTARIIRNGDPKTTATEYVLIWKNSDGTFGMSCAFGSYYELNLGYGLAYAARGTVITANDIGTNDFSFNTPSHPTWGGDITFNAMTVDAGAKTVSFDCDWALTGWNWDIQLTQVAL